MNFSEKLKLMREYKGLSIRQLALYSGVSAGFISQVESGKRGTPSPEILKKLYKPLGVEYNELLEAAGYIEKKEFNWEQFKEQNAIKELNDDDFVSVPIIGEVKAGYNLLAHENIIGYNRVPKSEMNGHTYFYLKVKGDSMIDKGINEGSLVKVRKQDFIEEDGKVAVVLIDNEEVTIKKLYHNHDHIILEAANENIPPKIYPTDRVKILGQVVKAEIDL